MRLRERTHDGQTEDQNMNTRVEVDKSLTIDLGDKRCQTHVNRSSVCYCGRLAICRGDSLAIAEPI